MKRSLVSSFVICLLLCGAAFSQGVPVIEKIEPPNWWTGHTINPVRVMVRGTGLKDAKVLSAKKDPIGTSNFRVNDRGDHLFFDLRIDAEAKPGKYELEIRSPAGNTRFWYEITEPLPAKDSFQGIRNDDVIYLIMPDRFANGDPSNDAPAGISPTANDRSNPRSWHGGDFKGITSKLPYLKELGITAIWLTPWYDNNDDQNDCDKPWCPNTNYHGYHTIDYYAVENRFGTMEDLKEMIREAHRLGIKVIQDQVANHVGVRHAWMKNPPLDDWFSPYTQNSFNNSVLLSPNASQAERKSLLEGWFNEFLPDNNHYEQEVAQYQIQNALWWVGMTGIDGIRQDTIQYMPREFIRDWSEAILKQYPDFWMVGEVFERDSAQTAFFQGGKTGWDGIDTKLPSVFDFRLWQTSQEVFTGRAPARALRDVLKYDGLYSDINNVTVLANNHDTDRFMSLPGATKEGAKMHIAFVLATRGIPQLYYGEEILMTGGHDPDNRKDFPGGWPGDKADKFSESGRTADEQEMWEWTRDWAHARKRSEALANGRTLDLLYNDQIYVFARQALNGETVVVCVNTADSSREISFRHSDLGLRSGTYTYVPRGSLVVDDEMFLAVDDEGMANLTVPGRTVSAFWVTRVARAVPRPNPY